MQAPDNPDKKDSLNDSLSCLKHLVRSHQRHKLHLAIFEKEPTLSTASKLCSKIPNLRLRSIVLTLAQQRAIISNKVYHWTTIENFKKVVQTSAFYGNKILQNHHIAFEKNSMGGGDIANGDEKVICFSPFLVCQTALVNDKQIKNNLIRLTIDLNKAQSYGKWNQFFKIHDLMGPAFHSIIRITNKLTVSFIKGQNELTIVFIFDDQRSSITLLKDDNIFYGNLKTINLACLLIFTSAIEQITNDVLKKNLLNYLNTCSDDELRKILVCFCQNLTIAAEYNFNAELPYSADMLTEIFFAQTEELVSLDPRLQQEPNKPLHHVIEQPSMSGIKSKKISLLNYKLDDKGNYILTQYGYSIDASTHTMPKIVRDLSQLNPNQFCLGEYVETRIIKENAALHLDIIYGSTSYQRLNFKADEMSQALQNLIVSLQEMLKVGTVFEQCQSAKCLAEIFQDNRLTIPLQERQDKVLLYFEIAANLGDVWAKSKLFILYLIGNTKLQLLPNIAPAELMVRDIVNPLEAEGYFSAIQNENFRSPVVIKFYLFLFFASMHLPNCSYSSLFNNMANFLNNESSYLASCYQALYNERYSAETSKLLQSAKCQDLLLATYAHFKIEPPLSFLFSDFQSSYISPRFS